MNGQTTATPIGAPIGATFLTRPNVVAPGHNVHFCTDPPLTHQLVTFLSDGATDLAGWTDRMNPTAEYVLDWFHIAMRFTVLANTMHGLKADPEFDDDPADIVGLEVELRRDIGRAKWHVWHGNIHDALELLSYTMFGLEGCAPNDAQMKAVKLVEELHRYLQRNQASIPSYAERHRAGEPISSAAAEATVNSVIAKRRPLQIGGGHRESSGFGSSDLATCC